MSHNQSNKAEAASKLGTGSIPSLMVKLALPSIVAQFINIFYNVVDRIYIGHIQSVSGASEALTGVGVCFPVLTLISAFAVFAGVGGAPRAAVELGKSEHDKSALKTANSYLGNAALLLTFFSALLIFLFQFFREPVLVAFGASSSTLPFASDYLRIYLYGTFAVMITMGLNPFISAQGHSKTAMLSTLIGAALNIILDPIFIFGLKLDVKGAAFATVISQCISAIWVLCFLLGKKSSIKLTWESLKPRYSVLVKITTLGVSPFVMSATESAIFVVFNARLQYYGGDLYVGAMTVLQSLMQLCFVPISGFTDGVHPLISYNYGARKMDRVRKVILSMTLISFAVTVLMWSLMMVFSRPSISIFTESPELIELCNSMLPIYFGAVWIFGLQMAAQRTFVALGKAETSIFIALLRKIILLIPLVYILPHFMGVKGIFFAEPIASTISAVTATAFLLSCYRRLEK